MIAMKNNDFLLQNPLLPEDSFQKNVGSSRNMREMNDYDRTTAQNRLLIFQVVQF